MAWGRAAVLEPDQWWESGDKNQAGLRTKQRESTQKVNLSVTEGPNLSNWNVSKKPDKPKIHYLIFMILWWHGRN